MDWKQPALSTRRIGLVVAASVRERRANHDAYQPHCRTNSLRGTMVWGKIGDFGEIGSFVNLVAVPSPIGLLNSFKSRS